MERGDPPRCGRKPCGLTAQAILTELLGALLCEVDVPLRVSGEARWGTRRSAVGSCPVHGSTAQSLNWSAFRLGRLGRDCPCASFG